MISSCSLILLITSNLLYIAPYGVREGLLKVEKKERRKFTAMTEDAIHYPSLSDYKMTNLFDDLLNFSVKHLRMDGRLV